VGTLFISHSSRDNETALKVSNWLRDSGWTHVFLDLDPVRGLAPGHQWQQELKRAGERCSAVILLISPDWVASRWCQTEFLVADQLGKKIFPLIITPTPIKDVPMEIRGRFQLADISTPEKEGEGFRRLALGLKRAGLDPSSFEWPPRSDPHRSIYRGLQSLDEQDAAIFFGRDAFNTKGLDALRRMRDGAAERMLVILGASGAGKSSFLKAGLLARLDRDEENFLVMPVVRPGRAALFGSQGLAASLGCDVHQMSDASELSGIFAQRRAAAMDRLERLADGVPKSAVTRPPTVVIPIDQAEELFSAENEDAARSLDTLAAIIRADQNVILIVTIRSDAFSRLQNDPRLFEVPRLPFDLPAIPLGAFKEVIEGPARLAQPPVTVDPDLVDRLLRDLDSEDALPLLAFTLERLALRRRSGGILSLAEYVEELGGLQGAITGAVDEAFAGAARDPALPHARVELEKLARAAFIPALVRLDHADAEPRRRLERIEALPQITRRLVGHLVNQHLLVSARSVINGIEADTIEVAHEAILRQWPSLKSWIAEERDALRALDSVRAAAGEWRAHSDREDGKQGQSWLVHRGGRLQEAEALLTRSGFTDAFDSTELGYLAACRSNDDDERLHEQVGILRTRRLQRNIGILISIAAVVVLLAGAGIVQLLAGMAARASDMLSTQAAKQSDLGNYDRGARYALAALAEADWPFTNEHYRSRAAAELNGASSASNALMVLSGHGDQVLGASFSPDGKAVVTASRDRTARVWSTLSGRVIAVLRGHGLEVMSAAFNRDGTRIITTSADKTARLWDVRTWRLVAILRGHGDVVAGAAFSPDGARVVTASWDGTARIWDTNSGRQIAVLEGHGNAFESAAFSPDGKRIVTASDDKTARIWDAAAARQIAVLNGHTSTVENAAFSPDGKRIVTASDDMTARIWDAGTSREITELRGHLNIVSTAYFSPDGKRVITASKDQTTRIWDADSGLQLAVIRGQDDSVNSAAFSPDGSRIVTASDDRTARVWDISPMRGTAVLRGHDNGVNSVAFSADDGRMVTASTDKTAAIWDTRTAREIVVLRGHQDLVETAAFSPDGKRVVTASDDMTARIWDAKSGNETAMLRGHQGKVFSAAFSPNGKRIVTASIDRTARVWDADTARQIVMLRGHKGGVLTAAFSPDGQRIVTGSADGTARLWNANSGNEIAASHEHQGAISSAFFSFDGARIVVAYRNGTVEIWDAGFARAISVLHGHEDAVVTAAFSLDGTRIVTASRDRTARIWDVGAAREIAVLRGHEGPVNNAVFSADGKRVATASEDNTARIWNVSTIVSATRDDLMRRVCDTTLARGLSLFSFGELREAPVLDARVDMDACHPPSLWARVGRVFWVN
jgi:WD40 repeat protein